MQSCLLVHLAERLVAHLQLEDRPAEAGQGALVPTRDDVEGARAEGSHAKQGEMSLATSSHQLTALSGVAAMLLRTCPLSRSLRWGLRTATPHSKTQRLRMEMLAARVSADAATELLFPVHDQQSGVLLTSVKLARSLDLHRTVVPRCDPAQDFGRRQCKVNGNGGLHWICARLNCAGVGAYENPPHDPDFRHVLIRPCRYEVSNATHSLSEGALWPRTRD